jgi:CDGSH-type Zn-finger protein
VVTGTGKTVNRVTEVWLCRCGHSRNKPYCDGSHKAAGFHSGS